MVLRELVGLPLVLHCVSVQTGADVLWVRGAESHFATPPLGLVWVGEPVISEDLLDVPLLHVTCGPPRNERLLAVLLQLSGVWCRCGCVPLGWSEPLWAVCGCVSLRDWFGRIPLLGELVLRSVLALGLELRAVWTELRPVGLSPPPPATEAVVLDIGPNTLGRWGELLLTRGGKLLLVLLVGSPFYSLPTHLVQNGFRSIVLSSSS